MAEKQPTLFTAQEVSESLNREFSSWQIDELMRVADWLSENCPDLWDDFDGQGREMISYIYESYLRKGLAKTGALKPIEDMFSEDDE